jgi:hypothetical protein
MYNSIQPAVSSFFPAFTVARAGEPVGGRYSGRIDGTMGLAARAETGGIGYDG